MSCSKHFLGLNWKQHDWRRYVTREASLSEDLTDMWGRRFQADHVVCHTQHICDCCGMVRDEGECTCEPEIGERCAIRLKYLAHPESPQA
jgi:hypothetical protein